MGHGGCKQRLFAQHGRLTVGGWRCLQGLCYKIVLFFSLRTMINYLSYVAVAYDHLRSYASAEPSDLINGDHCSHRLGEQYVGVRCRSWSWSAGRCSWLLVGVLLAVGVVENRMAGGMQAEARGCLVVVSCLGTSNT